MAMESLAEWITSGGTVVRNGATEADAEKTKKTEADAETDALKKPSGTENNGTDGASADVKTEKSTSGGGNKPKKREKPKKTTAGGTSGTDLCASSGAKRDDGAENGEIRRGGKHGRGKPVGFIEPEGWRDERGRFKKGVRAYEEAYFQKENAEACKYHEKYADELLRYFSVEAFSAHEREDGGMFYVPSRLPTFERFAVEHHVTAETLKNWCKLSTRFADAYEKAKHLQKDVLITNGLVGAYNANFARFIAISEMNMRDKVETEGTMTVSVKLDEETDEEAQ